MRGLRQIASWGGIAAGALLIAVLTGPSEVGSQRIAVMLTGNQGPPRP